MGIRLFSFLSKNTDVWFLVYRQAPSKPHEDGMEVDVSAEKAYENMNTSLGDQQPKNFVHKNSKAHRFEPKKNNNQIGGGKRGKFDNNNRHRGRGGSQNSRGREGHDRSSSNDRASSSSSNNKRKFDDNGDSKPPKGKFLKPS
jgi:hypothetical protein